MFLCLGRMTFFLVIFLASFLRNLETPHTFHQFLKCMIIDVIGIILTTRPFENAFLASPRVSNLAHFQHVLLTSFQVRFLSDFVTFLKPSGAPFGTIFQKKTLPKIASKKGPPT